MTILDRLLGRGGGDVLGQREETRRIIHLLQDGLTPEEAAHDLVRRRVQLLLKVQRQGVHLFDSSSSSGASG